MSDFKLQAMTLHAKITHLLENSIETDDFFVHFYFSQLLEMYRALHVLYQDRLAELERKILNLEKELIFCGLTVENYI
jgi:hypothetical protein